MSEEKPGRDVERDEYKATVETYRFFVNLRFVTVAFAMTLQAGLFALYERASSEEPVLRLAISMLAIVLVVAIFIVEWRTTFLFHDARKRGRDLERQLGILNGMLGRLIELNKDDKIYSRVTHTVGINVVYGALLALWLFVLVFTITKITQPTILPRTPEQKEKINVGRENKS